MSYTSAYLFDTLVTGMGGGGEGEQAGHHREGESEAANFVEGAANHRSHNLALGWKSVLLLLLLIIVVFIVLVVLVVVS